MTKVTRTFSLGLGHYFENLPDPRRPAYVVAPGTPRDRAQLLRKAFADTMNVSRLTVSLRVSDAFRSRP